MWLILVGLTLLAGDVLSQANNVINSKTDLLALESDQSHYPNDELISVEDQNFDLPFGDKLPGYEKPLFAYSYTVSNKSQNRHSVNTSDKNSNSKRNSGSENEINLQSFRFMDKLNIFTTTEKNVLHTKTNFSSTKGKDTSKFNSNDSNDTFVYQKSFSNTSLISPSKTNQDNSIPDIKLSLSLPEENNENSSSDAISPKLTKEDNLPFPERLSNVYFRPSIFDMNEKNSAEPETQVEETSFKNDSESSISLDLQYLPPDAGFNLKPELKLTEEYLPPDTDLPPKPTLELTYLPPEKTLTPAPNVVQENSIFEENSTLSSHKNFTSRPDLKLNEEYLPPRQDLPSKPALELNYLPPEKSLPLKPNMVQKTLPPAENLSLTLDKRVSSHPNVELNQEYLPPTTKLLPQPSLEVTYLPPDRPLTRKPDIVQEYLPPEKKVASKPDLNLSYLPPDNSHPNPVLDYLPPQKDMSSFLSGKNSDNKPAMEKQNNLPTPNLDYLPPQPSFQNPVNKETHQISPDNEKIHQSLIPVGISRNFLPPVISFQPTPPTGYRDLSKVAITNKGPPTFRGDSLKSDKISPSSILKDLRDEPIHLSASYNKPQPYSIQSNHENEPIIATADYTETTPIIVIQSDKPQYNTEIDSRKKLATAENHRNSLRGTVTPNVKAGSFLKPIAVDVEKPIVEEKTSAKYFSPIAEIKPNVNEPKLHLKNNIFTPVGIIAESRENYNEPKLHLKNSRLTTPLGVITESRQNYDEKNQFRYAPIADFNENTRFSQIYTHSPIALSHKENAVLHPIKKTKEASFIISSGSQDSCFSNDECNEKDVCLKGKCIPGCSLATNLCVGYAVCETKYHVPACVCPLMSTARTIKSEGILQFDCIPMMMSAPTSNIIGRFKKPITTRFKSFSYQRPIVGPVRSDTSIRPIAETYEDPCARDPCGPNTRCERKGKVALCRCIEEYVPRGNTIVGCKPQCTEDNDCPDDYRCDNQKCVRVCVPGACGLNADCDSRGHRPYCSCPPGYNGNPDSKCSRTVPEIRAPPPLPVDPCLPNPCGTNAGCRARGERPVCSCPAGYEGNPLSSCVRGECIAHTDCPKHRACQGLRCIDPCVGVCGRGAECTVREHQPVCSCPRNHIGDPFDSCRRITEYDICNPSPCGRGTNCKVKHDRLGNMRAVCSCIDNYVGNPLSECRPECETSDDCNFDQECRNYRCRNPCIDGCGEGAYCDARNHRAVCTCPEYFLGDPHSRCYAECDAHEKCPDYQACYQFRCIDPCEGACGVGANCKVENHTPICSCPKDHTGDPFTSCRPFTLEDLCRGNPCGTNSECFPGKDRSGNDRPVCTCPVGYIGNPIVSCQRGDCTDHNECPDHQACYAYMCQSPCYTEKGSVCGINAECKVKDHKPICSCPRGYSGNPLDECRVSPGARVAGRTYRKK